MEVSHKYLEAKRSRAKVKELAQVELLRQMKFIQKKHERELIELGEQHRLYASDF